MAVTLTKTAGPTAIGPGLKMATYVALMDTSYPTNGEAIDLTGEFDYLYCGICGGNDTVADNGYKFGIKGPGYATAVTSTNVVITAHWNKDPGNTGGADIAFPEVANTTDLSGVGELQLLVIGK